MSGAVDIRLAVNGEPVARRAPARLTLVDFLREELGLIGTRAGCEHGVCGACTVRLDGQIVRACLVFAAQLDGAVVESTVGRMQITLQNDRTRTSRAACGFLIAKNRVDSLPSGHGRLAAHEYRDLQAGEQCVAQQVSAQ